MEKIFFTIFFLIVLANQGIVYCSLQKGVAVNHFGLFLHYFEIIKLF